MSRTILLFSKLRSSQTSEKNAQKNNLSPKFWIGALLLMLMSGVSWGQTTSIIPQLYLSAQNTPSGNSGWTITATTNNASTDYWKMLSTTNSMTSPSMNFSLFSNVTLTMSLQSFGTVASGSNNTKIEYYDGSTWSQVGSLLTPTTKANYTVTLASTAIASSAQIRITAPNATSSAGVRVYSVDIKGTTQATSITSGSVTSATIPSISCTNGSGSKRAIFIKAASTGSATPVNNTTYTANTVFGSGTQIASSGWYCIFNGTGTPSVTVTGLNSSTTYRVMVCEYDGAAAAEVYNTYASGTGNPANFTTLSSGLSTPPTLTAAGSATVDAPFNVTFTDDATWRAAIDSIKIGGTKLTAGFSASAGQITFTPSASSPASLLQSSGSKSIVIYATGYSDATATQTIGVGVPANLSMTVQPTAPAASGAVLATMPQVTVKDQYNNNISGSVVTAAVTSGQGSSWTIGGATQTATTNASGVATFSTLTATNSTSPSAPFSATITFTPGSGSGSVTSNSFTIPGIAPTLTAALGATVDNAFNVTFTDNSAWRAAITGITVGTALSASAYSTTSAGQITFTPSASTLLQTPGNKTIVISATGYPTATVSQTIGVGAAAKLSMNTQPTAPATNGAALATQPKVNILDQYNNQTTSTASVTAAVGAGTWTLGGTASVNAVAGVATFSGLTATSAVAVTGATIAFTSSGFTGVTSGTFNIPAPTPVNDICSGSLELTANGASITVDNSTATNDALPTPSCGSATSTIGTNKGLWYKVTPSANGTLTISTCSSASGDLYLRAYTGTCGSFTACAGFDDDGCGTSSGPAVLTISNAVANTTYYVLLGLYNTSATGISTTISATLVPFVYYSKSTGDLDQLSTWGSNTDGTGIAPLNFTTSGTTYNVRNNANPTIGAAWTVSGTNSKIVVGNGTTATNFTIPSSFAVTGTIDVSANATLTIANTTIPTLGTLAATSTVDFASTSSQSIPAANYGNLTNSGNGDRVLASSGTIGIAGTLTPTTGNRTITGSTISYNGSLAQTIAAVSYNNLTTNNAAGCTTGGNITVIGTLTVTQGMTVAAGHNLTLSGVAALMNVAASKTVTVNGTITNTAAVIDIASIASTTTTATVTTSSAHGLTSGQLVYILGNSTNNYNTSVPVSITVTTTTTFTYTITSFGGSGTGGIVSVYPFKSTTGSVVSFASGSNYVHNQNGGYILNSAATTGVTYNSAATIQVIGATSNIPFLPASSPNVIWNCPSQTQQSNFIGTTPTTINGNLTVQSTGSGYITIGQAGTARVLNVSGNVDIQGGLLYVQGASTGTVLQTMNVTGNLGVSGGTLNLNGSSSTGTALLNVTGNLSHTSGTITSTSSSSGTIALVGTAAGQTVTTNGFSGSTNLTINNTSSGITLNSDITIPGLLTFTKGIITTNANKVILGAASSTSGAAQNTGWVNGNLQKNVATGSNVTRTFESGGPTYYRPITLNFATVSTAGDVTVNSTSGSHPQLVSSNVDSLLRLNRYYTLSNSGVGFTTYDATFNFVASDILNNATTSSFIVGNYTNGSWSYPTVGTKTATSTQATGLTGFGDFAIGQSNLVPGLAGSTLTAFGNVCINTTTSANTFIITGSNLDNTNITVSSLAGFTFSTDNISYSASLSIAQPGGAYVDTIYVKFTPTAVQSYAGNIVIGGGGAADVNVAASGSGINTAPSLTASAATSISSISATIPVTISFNGCSSVSAYGVEFSTTNGFANGSGTQVAGTNLSGGNFSVGLTSLNPTTTYYYKAYATNNGGTTYTAQGTFTTATPSISVGAITAFGNVCLNTTTTANTFTITGTNLTTANVTIASLAGFTYSTDNTTYSSSLSITQSGGSYSGTIYVKFTPTLVQSYNGNIVVAGGGVSAGVNRSVTASGVNTTPSITASAATSTSSTSSTIPATISSNGCSSISAYGIEYSTSSGFINGTGTQVAGNNLTGGSFSVPLSGLNPSTTYYYKAFATNSGGTTYSTQGSFTTLTPSISVGAITAFGNVCLNTTTTANSFTITGTNLTTANITIASLAGFTYSTDDITYSSSLSITQSGGSYLDTIYVKFTPTAVQSYSGNIGVAGGGVASTVNRSVTGAGVNTAPSVTTGTPATGISQTNATLGGSITANGCTSITAYGIEYSTNNGFTNGTGTQVAASNLSAGAYSVSLSNLTPNTTYYYKAYATNNGGTSYGTQQTVTTSSLDAPTLNAPITIAYNGFTPSWNTVNAASSYRLDVATNSSFTTTSTIASEGFENVLSLFSQTTGTGVYYSGNSSTSDIPSSSSFANSGTYGFGITNGSVTITSNNINTSGTTNNQLSFKLAAFGITTGGLDQGDIVTVQISPDGGSTYYSTIRVLGNSNATWPFTGSVTASTAYDGNTVPVDFQANSSATDGYGTVIVTGLPTVSNLRVRITLLNNAASERWIIDNLSVTGTLSTMLSGYNDLTVNGTSQSVTGLSENTKYYYRVRSFSATSTSANSIIDSVTTYKDPATADYRTKQTGNLSLATTWEYNFTGSSYQNATSAPNSNNNVTVQNGHVLTLDTNFTVGNGKTLYMNATSSMIVNPTKILTIAGTAAFNNQSVTFKSNGTGAGILGSVTGSITGGNNITVERYLSTPEAWRFVSSGLNSTGTIRDNWQEGGSSPANFGTYITSTPNTGALGFDFTTSPASTNSMFTYTSGAGPWNSVANTNVLTLKAGTGYRLWVRSDRTTAIGTTTSWTRLRTTGTPVTGTVTMVNTGVSSPASNELAVLTPNANGYSLVGNPYWSPVDWQALTKTNVIDFYWAWDPKLAGTAGHRDGRYVLVNGSNGVTNAGSNSNVSKIIQPGQAIFVKNAATGTPSIQWTESAKSSSQTAIYKTTTVEGIVKATLNEDTSYVDAAMVFYANGYNDAIDASDAGKLSNPNENISILRNATQLTMESRNEIATTDTIPLRISSLNNNYSYNLTTDINNMPSTVQGFLLNTDNGNTSPLNMNGTTMIPITVTGSLMTNYKIVFTNSGTPLSVKDIKLTASKQNNAIVTKWTATEEQAVNNYTVEKSTNGKDFTAVQVMSSKGNGTNEYTWTDEQPADGNNLYRIKATNIDGKQLYSNTALVRWNAGTASSLTIYPNPVTDANFTLSLNNMASGEYQATLYSANGQVVYTQTIQHETNNTTATIQMNQKLSNGAYYLVLTNGTESFKQNITIQNK